MFRAYLIMNQNNANTTEWLNEFHQTFENLANKNEPTGNSKITAGKIYVFLGKVFRF